MARAITYRGGRWRIAGLPCQQHPFVSPLPGGNQNTETGGDESARNSVYEISNNPQSLPGYLGRRENGGAQPGRKTNLDGGKACVQSRSPLFIEHIIYTSNSQPQRPSSPRQLTVVVVPEVGHHHLSRTCRAQEMRVGCEVCA